MTTTFDGLIRLIHAYKDQLDEDDYQILCHAIDAIHDVQHAENNHKIDALNEWRNGTAKINDKKRCMEKCKFCGSQCCFVGEHDNHYCYGHSEVEEATR